MSLYRLLSSSRSLFQLVVVFFVCLALALSCSDTTTETQKSASSAKAITAQPDPNCSYAEHNGHEYWFCRDNRRWEEARSKCVVIGMHLVRINNFIENNFVHDNMKKDSWIGATDKGSNGVVPI